MSVRSTQNWFAKFRSGNMSLEDDHVGGLQPAIKNDRLKLIMEQNLRTTVKQLAKKTWKKSKDQKSKVIQKQSEKSRRWTIGSLLISLMRTKSITKEISHPLLSRKIKKDFWSLATRIRFYMTIVPLCSVADKDKAPTHAKTGTTPSQSHGHSLVDSQRGGALLLLPTRSSGTSASYCAKLDVMFHKLSKIRQLLPLESRQ